MTNTTNLFDKMIDNAVDHVPHNPFDNQAQDNHPQNNHVINATDTPQAQTTQSSTNTSILNLTVQSALTPTNDFTRVLTEIPAYVLQANTLLEDYRNDADTFLSTVNDAELDTALKEMEEVSKYARQIDESRKEIKRYLNTVRDDVMAVLDARLEQARYPELERARKQIQQLKKDVIADRAEKRWGELRPTFEANINRYQTLSEIAPELADFSRFRLIFPKLVSGAKTRVIREKDHTMINETIYAWNTATELIKANKWQLALQDLNTLLSMFKQNPSIELVEREGERLRLEAVAREEARQKAEALRIKREEEARIEREKREKEMARLQEQARLAEQQRNVQSQQEAERKRQELERLAQEQAMLEQQRRAEFQNFGGQYQTMFKESFPLFIEYLFQNAQYHDIRVNSATRASVLFDIFQQVQNPQSVVVRETQNNPDKVLELVRYILDV